MNLSVDSPWVLSALALAVLPLFSMGIKTNAMPWVTIVPVDFFSIFFAGMLRLAAMTAIIGIILALSGLHLRGQTIEHIGSGAHIVLLLDRSNSMDNTFAGKTPNGKEESKANAARGLLNDFIEQRKHDLIGVAEFSTTPLFVVPLTENKLAVRAAIEATATPALAYTHVSKGLAMALSFFDEQPASSSRIILLVSDGAAAIDPETELKLREWFTQKQVRLYWIFLRTANSPGIFDKPKDSREDNAQAMPELYLHKFFSSLGIPYKAYEAESPNVLKNAFNDINQLETAPLRYFERIPKQDLSHFCYTWSALMIAFLLAVRLLLVKVEI